MPDFVSVPVPSDRVQEVYALLAREPVRPSADRTAREDGRDDGWNHTLIERMFVESSSAMRRILAAVAQQSPGWVTTGQIAIASGLTVRQVIASLGPFEKRVRGRYGMSEWPFAARQFVDEGIFKYSMSPETATWILDLTAQLQEHEKERS